MGELVVFSMGYQLSMQLDFFDLNFCSGESRDVTFASCEIEVSQLSAGSSAVVRLLLRVLVCYYLLCCFEKVAVVLVGVGL